MLLLLLLLFSGVSFRMEVENHIILSLYLVTYVICLLDSLQYFQQNLNIFSRFLYNIPFKNQF